MEIHAILQIEFRDGENDRAIRENANAVAVEAVFRVGAKGRMGSPGAKQQRSGLDREARSGVGPGIFVGFQNPGCLSLDEKYAVRFQEEVAFAIRTVQRVQLAAILDVQTGWGAFGLEDAAVHGEDEAFALSREVGVQPGEVPVGFAGVVFPEHPQLIRRTAINVVANAVMHHFPAGSAGRHGRGQGEEHKRGDKPLHCRGAFPITCGVGRDIVYFDLETQRTANDVGGWGNKHAMGMSVGVTFSTATGEYVIYSEAEVENLIAQLRRADLVVGYNLINFDYHVLMGYTALDLPEFLPTLDLMVDLERAIGHRLPLEAVAQGTFGVGKIAEGLDAIRWWREGKVLEIAEYCCFDVKVTRMVHEHGVRTGELFYQDRFSRRQRVEVPWGQAVAA